MAKKESDSEGGMPGAGDGVKRSSIQDFIGEVGRGFAEAQEALDQRSLQYLCTDPIMPSRFAVSKMSAEINFAVEAKEGKALNMLFYGSSSERKQEQQQRVSFDLVAAPLPPDMMPALGSAKQIPQGAGKMRAAGGLRRALVFDAATRSRIQQVLEEAKSDIDLADTLILERPFGGEGDHQGAGAVRWVLLTLNRGAQIADARLRISEILQGKDALEVKSSGSSQPAKVYAPLIDILFVFLELQKTIFSDGNPT